MIKLVMTILCFFQFSAWAAEVDTKASEVKWKATKKVTGGHNGVIGVQSGKVELKAGKIQSGELVIDMNTIEVQDLSGSWKDKLTGHLKSDDFFMVSKFPTAKFVVESHKDNTVTGRLTIKDKTQPVTINFENNDKTYTGKFEFDRTKFDMVYNSENFVKNLVADKIINDNVEVEFKIMLK